MTVMQAPHSADNPTTGSNMDYEITWFTPENRDDFVTFLASFSGQQYSPESFVGADWWVPTNPLGGFLLIAHTKEEIAARGILTGRKLVYRDQVVDCFEIGGTYTQPQHQRRGLFKRIVKKAMELGFETPAQLIYGTPNDRSGPGYRKLGYSFIDQQDSHFALIPRTIHPVLRRVGLKRGAIEHVPPPEPTKQSGTCVINELNLDQYIAETTGLPRINWTGDDYLRRRFAGSGTGGNRRFFRIDTAGGPFCCALRHYCLTFLRLLLVSEYFLDGRIDSGSTTLRLLRRIASTCYRNHDGVYLKCSVDPSEPAALRVLRQQLLVHRELPICYTINPNTSTDAVERMMQELTPVFQLTDCDIG